ncbi:DUF4258 domain-containing protein [Candidatus Woesearchaeota archaeon]|nr:DUF4258 domain-containing protein [Candidatus Woesearchaeota archaeon]
MVDRKTAEITFDSHVFTRQLERNFDLDFVEETVRSGVIDEEKSAPPTKFCITKYHGKERQTYCVIVIYHNQFIEVKTVWLSKGR